MNSALMNSSEREFAATIAALNACNPFEPKRVQLEREALGAAHQDHGRVWHADTSFAENPNLSGIQMKVEQLAQAVRTKLLAHRAGSPVDQNLYRELVLYVLYHRFQLEFEGLILAPTDAMAKVRFYERFLAEYHHFLGPCPDPSQPHLDPAVLFGLFFQIRRAFHHIYVHIFGGSHAASKLRARIWQSIFTHDMSRYRRALYTRMGDIATLVTGPSGTGKELVAQAIGQSRFLPFDGTNRRFHEDFRQSFFPLNLAALSPTLIESELFGHKRGSFTGAISDRMGWLESCSSLGSVFLDEIGELDAAIQVKLLRVLQTRTFQRLGETRTRTFAGKVIAATNRDLAASMNERTFREDLYYRLCSDLVKTPSLFEQVEHDPNELHSLVEHIATQVAGPEESEQLAREVISWIDQNLPNHYHWPGNFRELEQCVRNILVRGAYVPASPITTEEATWSWSSIKNGSLSAEVLLQGYCHLIYRQTNSYVACAAKLGLDRRTVKAKVEAFQHTHLKAEIEPSPNQTKTKS